MAACLTACELPPTPCARSPPPLLTLPPLPCFALASNHPYALQAQPAHPRRAAPRSHRYTALHLQPRLNIPRRPIHRSHVWLRHTRGPVPALLLPGAPGGGAALCPGHWHSLKRCGPVWWRVQWWLDVWGWAGGSASLPMRQLLARTRCIGVRGLLSARCTSSSNVWPAASATGTEELPPMRAALAGILNAGFLLHAAGHASIASWRSSKVDGGVRRRGGMSAWGHAHAPSLPQVCILLAALARKHVDHLFRQHVHPCPAVRLPACTCQSANPFCCAAHRLRAGGGCAASAARRAVLCPGGAALYFLFSPRSPLWLLAVCRCQPCCTHCAACWALLWWRCPMSPSSTWAISGQALIDVACFALGVAA